MATIQIKRGLQENLNKLVLSEGEMAVALDTGNVYIGTTAGKTHLNPTGGLADEAIKLKTARSFSASGDAAAPAVSFDGTGNVALALTLAAMPSLAAGTYTKLTVDAKGRVTAAQNIALGDLPSIPTSKITGLGSAATKTAGAAAGNVLLVGTDGKIDASVLPSIALTDVFEAASQAAMLALSAQAGDVCIRTDEAKSYILAAAPASTLANWKWLKTPDCKILSVNGKTGAVTLSAADVGAETPSGAQSKADGAKAAAIAAAATDAQNKANAAEANAKAASRPVTWTPTAANVGAEPKLAGVAAKAAPADADGLVLLDSAAASATKKLLWSGVKSTLKAYFDTLYNKYVLPSATTTVLGGVKVGDGLSVSAGLLSVGDVDGGTF